MNTTKTQNQVENSDQQEGFLSEELAISKNSWSFLSTVAGKERECKRENLYVPMRYSRERREMQKNIKFSSFIHFLEVGSLETNSIWLYWKL